MTAILMGVFFSLIPALAAGLVAWFLYGAAVPALLIVLLLFLFGLDVCFRGSKHGKD